MGNTEIQTAFQQQKIPQYFFFHPKQQVMDPSMQEASRYIPHLKTLLVPQAFIQHWWKQIPCPVIETSFSAGLYK